MNLRKAWRLCVSPLVGAAIVVFIAFLALKGAVDWIVPEWKEAE